jgi:hypothetical protein
VACSSRAADVAISVEVDITISLRSLWHPNSIRRLSPHRISPGWRSIALEVRRRGTIQRLTELRFEDY